LNQERSEIINRKVSVVIPTKDAGVEFKNTLEKIRGQRGIREIETVIVDSGSEDNTVILAGVWINIKISQDLYAAIPRGQYQDYITHVKMFSRRNGCFWK
jgi:glycosyltransferase involved in cell wall biosynthesis